MQLLEYSFKITQHLSVAIATTEMTQIMTTSSSSSSVSAAEFYFECAVIIIGVDLTGWMHAICESLELLERRPTLWSCTVWSLQTSTENTSWLWIKTRSISSAVSFWLLPTPWNFAMFAWLACVIVAIGSASFCLAIFSSGLELRGFCGEWWIYQKGLNFDLFCFTSCLLYTSPSPRD